MRYYPVYLDLNKKKCVIIGGGKIAERKIGQLLKAGAKVTVVSPDLTPVLDKMRADGKISHKKRKYKSCDIKGAFLVIAATSDEEVNKKAAKNFRGLINAVDMPKYCSFIMPSVISRGPLTIAISSSGVSPALSKTLRKELEGLITDDLAKYLAYLDKLRPAILKALPGPSEGNIRKREAILKELGSPKMLRMLRQKGLTAVRAHADELIRKNCAPDCPEYGVSV
jgi:precorrin-2 dehydrogenase / sirohydrochlorin ferrochelatase